MTSLLQLCLAIVVVCEAARIPRVTEQPYFPNFQDIYPNRNYQTESVNNQDDGPFFGNYRAHEGNAGIGNEFYDHRTPIGGRANFVHHLTRGNVRVLLIISKVISKSFVFQFRSKNLEAETQFPGIMIDLTMRLITIISYKSFIKFTLI